MAESTTNEKAEKAKDAKSEKPKPKATKKRPTKRAAGKSRKAKVNGKAKAKAKRATKRAVKRPKPKRKVESSRKSAALKLANAKPRKRRPAKASTNGPVRTNGMSMLDAAAKVLGESGADGPLRVKDLVSRMAEKGYWKSPNGKTPAATLYGAMMKEVNTKGDASRFARVDKGLFAVTSAAAN